MAQVKPNTTIQEYQDFVQEVYGIPNDRYYDTSSMLTNIQRFVMRGIKGIRKNDNNKITLNLLIAQSWFMSLMNRFHIPLQEAIWNRFPYLCSYCGSLPCVCKAQKVNARKHITPNATNIPGTYEGFQAMFMKIYPPSTRSIEHAGIHLSEELGELSEAVLKYQGTRDEKSLAEITAEAADFFSCLMGVFNSLTFPTAKELAVLFSNNCHACKKAPCECTHAFVTEFES
ncbi:MAG: MazG-like family protein [Candidatus Wildermuthbacteria bacterium]|nr:MazG-like family protein [Candidatus Wildermuthbacteria bacterium]